MQNANGGVDMIIEHKEESIQITLDAVEACFIRKQCVNSPRLYRDLDEAITDKWGNIVVGDDFEWGGNQ